MPRNHPPCPDAFVPAAPRPSTAKRITIALAGTALALGIALPQPGLSSTTDAATHHAIDDNGSPRLSVARRVELQLEIGHEDRLPATLTLPRGAGPFAAVVLVHGSGAHDRDETIGAIKPFRDIAHGLAQRGIAVLRYEKRTHRHPELLSSDGFTVDLETTHDALLAIARLRQLRAIDPRRIFVLGHSQGGMLAPRIAARAPDVAGIILLAAPSRPLLDLIAEQHRRLALLDDGMINDAEQLALRRLAEGTRAIRAGLEPAPSRLPMGLSARYWRSVEAIDPIAEAATIRQPMLVLQGGRDLQVVSLDWLRWRRAFAGAPRVTFARYDTLNHLGVPERGPPSARAYLTPATVSAELIDDTALWIGWIGDLRRD